MIDSDEDAPSAPTYTEEQRSLKEDLKSALNSVVDEEPVLTLRPKSDNDKVNFYFPIFMIAPVISKHNKYGSSLDVLFKTNWYWAKSAKDVILTFYSTINANRKRKMKITDSG